MDLFISAALPLDHHFIATKRSKAATLLRRCDSLRGPIKKRPEFSKILGQVFS